MATRRVPYTYVLDFNSIATTATGPGTLAIDGDADFVIEDMAFLAYAASGEVPAAPRSGETAANNTAVFDGQLAIQIETPGYKWQNDFVRIPNFLRAGVQNLSLTQRKLQAGVQLSGRLQNNSGSTIKAQLALIGYKEVND
jgi:hypothetical protein